MESVHPRPDVRNSSNKPLTVCPRSNSFPRSQVASSSPAGSSASSRAFSRTMSGNFSCQPVAAAGWWKASARRVVAVFRNGFPCRAPWFHRAIITYGICM